MRMLDRTDIEILSLLTDDARQQWREIGEKVHLTGQAVANRVHRMEKMGIIQRYTIDVNNKKLGKSLTAFITIFMKTNDHDSFKKFIKESEFVIEANRISGEGCYLLKVIASNNKELTEFLDRILIHGNYRVNLSIENIK